MLVYVLCHLGKICGKHSESDWDFSFARRNIRIRIYVQHILLFLNSSINMHLFKTMGRKPSPDQLQIRLSCHVLSILGWKYFCGRSGSTSAIRLLGTKYFLFSSWEWGQQGGSSVSSILTLILFGSSQIYQNICGLELMKLHLHIVWLLITVGSQWDLMWHYDHSTANKCNVTKVEPGKAEGATSTKGKYYLIFLMGEEIQETEQRYLMLLQTHLTIHLDSDGPAKDGSHC